MNLSNIEKSLNELNLLYNQFSDHFTIIRVKDVVIDSITAYTRDSLLELRTSGIKYSYHFHKLVDAIVKTRNEFGRFTHFEANAEHKVHIRTVVSEQISQIDFIEVVQAMFREMDTVRRLLCCEERKV